MRYDGFRFTQHNFAVTHLDYDGLITVRACPVNPDEFSWEQPAHGQRLNASLTIPSLLSVHADPVIVGTVGKWADGDDVVLLIQPAGISSSHDVAEDGT